MSVANYRYGKGFLMESDNMKIGFIGAGKVGTAFGMYLKQNGLTVYGYYSRTFESALMAAEFTGTKAEKELKDIVVNADILFITTNDNEISRVCERLVNENLINEEKIIVHMSGAASSKILSRVKEKGCYIYSLHPLQAFADVNKAVNELKSTIFSLEGDEEKIDVIENILKTIGNTYFKITSDQKAIYHATACVVSNYLVTLIDYGLSLFQSIGIEKASGYKALYPLIEGTIKNIYELGTEKALTGPIARGDTATIHKHMEALKRSSSDFLELYKILGIETIDLASKEKLRDNKKVTELKNILKEV